MPKYKIGDYVNIRHKDDWHIGIVLDIFDNNDDNVPFIYQILDMITETIEIRRYPENICLYGETRY